MMLTQHNTQSASWTWLATVVIVVAFLTPWPFDLPQASSWDQPEVVADEDDRDRDRDNDVPVALALPSLAATVPLTEPDDYRHREPLLSSFSLICHIGCPRPPPLALL